MAAGSADADSFRLDAVEMNKLSKSLPWPDRALARLSHLAAVPTKRSPARANRFAQSVSGSPMVPEALSHWGLLAES
jgi:hypothetical protein